ncbi:MAG TPA: glycerophosphodiester phosphodiesterase [Acidimicrobiales bacterium]|nr:glycerophosphodiester phosphodiesterase [Acidimicrobiales bacterium]
MISLTRLGGAAAVALVALGGAGAVASADPPPAAPEANAAVEPLVVAHRGASGYRPEHTLAAYELAIDMGADVIEPDLVSTSDGVLVARHENQLSDTTDVEDHPEFAERRTTKVVDGRSVTDWFTEDFTLAELKALRAEERLPELRPDNTVFDGLHEIPTLQEVIDLAQAHGVGIYPETKHPTYFDSIGLSLEEPLVETLHANGWDKPTDPVFIQSFETTNLRELDGMTGLRLVQLLSGGGAPYDLRASGDDRTYADLATATGLRWISSYADGVGPSAGWVIPRNPDGSLGEPTGFVDDAHRAGLVVHPYTFRNENTFLPTDFRAGDPTHPGYDGATGDAAAYYQAFFDAGIDGMFSDHPDTAVAARDAWRDSRGGGR